MTGPQPHGGVNRSAENIIVDLSRALGHIEALAGGALAGSDAARRRALRQIVALARSVFADTPPQPGPTPAGVAGYAVGTRHPQERAS